MALACFWCCSFIMSFILISQLLEKNAPPQRCFFWTMVIICGRSLVNQSCCLYLVDRTARTQGHPERISGGGFGYFGLPTRLIRNSYQFAHWDFFQGVSHPQDPQCMDGPACTLKTVLWWLNGFVIFLSLLQSTFGAYQPSRLKIPCFAA